MGRCLPDLDWSGVVGYEIVFGYMTGGFGKSGFACHAH
jgi:hypothetical protein